MLWGNLMVLAAVALASGQGQPSFRGPLVEGLARAEVDGRWGYVDAGGTWVIPAAWDWAESFADGLAAVRRDGRWGFVDRTGKVVIAPRFVDVDSFSEGLAAVLTERNAGWSYIDKRGQVRLGPYVDARRFTCGQARVKVDRVFLLGSTEHGDFVFRESALSAAAHVREQAMDRLEAALRHQPGPAPATTAGVPALDDFVLERQARAGTASSCSKGGVELPGHALEPQWDEGVWQTIDATGAVLPPGRPTACAGAPPPPAPPKGLAATLAGMHRRCDRTPIFRQLVELGPAVLPDLQRALRAPQPQTRLNALEVALRMGETAAPLAPPVVARLDDPHPQSFTLAAWTLGRMRQASPEVVLALLGHRGRDRELVDRVVATLLPLPPSTSQAMRGALDDAGKAQTAAAAVALGGQLDAEMKARLFSIAGAGLAAADEGVRGLAARTLALLDAKQAPELRTRILEAAAREHSPGVLLDLSRVLLALDRPGAVDALGRLLTTPEWKTALALLDGLGKEAGGAARRLRALAEWDDEHAPDNACERLGLAAGTLWNVTGDARAVLPLLYPKLVPSESATADEHPMDEELFPDGCDLTALALLGRMGPAAQPAASRVRRYQRLTKGTADAGAKVLKAIGGSP